MKALHMSAGHFEMAPLSEFTVTETKYRRKGDPLPTMDWHDWRTLMYERGVEVDYHFAGVAKDGRKTINMNVNRPTDVEVVLSAHDAQYYVIVWEDDPDAA